MAGKKIIMGVVLICLILSGLTGIGFSEGVRADTPVEGEILVDTTWTTTGSPYLVTNDVTVDKNATLTIQAGVTVKFGGYCSIIVNGNLSAVGTSGNEITFTSNAPTPASGDWNTTKFMGGVNKTFTVKHCVFEYGANAVTISSMGVSVVENCDFHNNTGAGVHIIGEVDALIKDNIIYSNKYGISSEGSTVSGVNIEGNTITNNNLTTESHGIYLYASGSSPEGSASYSIYDVNITGNTISSNGGNGIYLYAYTYTYYHNSESYFYIYNVNITGNIVSFNGGSGIYLYAYAYAYYSNYNSYFYIYDVTISGNTVSSNGGSGIYLYADASSVHSVHYPYSYIYNVNITGNTVSSNGGSGIYLYPYSHTIYESDSYIYDVTISGNTVSFNGGNGIYLYAYAHHYYGTAYSYIYNVNITDNTVFSNTGSGIKTYSQNHYTGVEFDITLYDNLVCSNNQGIVCSGGAKANITNNSIAYNEEHGVLFDTCTGNAAHYNDIYRNLFGMNVSNSASVNAENNYWGDASGPYHSTMNYEGTGNPVNGVGTDLDFMPYLTTAVGVINQRPVAHLTADKTSVVQNENINFDASSSTDDNKVVEYFFDFDDGTNTGWITASTATHSYSSEGTYNATVVVRDEYGVKSNNTAKKTITVGVPAGITSHSTILIESNSDFTSENGVVSGSGTQSNPYIIEGWDIDASSGGGYPGIFIKDTDAYFIIRNCYVYNGESNEQVGIWLYNVQNGIIDNVTLWNNLGGIHLSSSSDNSIANCHISKSGGFNGIYLSNSSNNRISNCEVYDGSSYGVSFDYSSNYNTISSCTVYNNVRGIFFDHFSNNTIVNSCTIYNSTWDGICLFSSGGVQITNCTCYNNSAGINLDSSSGIEIHYCNIYGNTGFGIYNTESAVEYQVNATNCWWGSTDGPSVVGPGTGDKITSNVLYDPWLTEPWTGAGATVTETFEDPSTGTTVDAEYTGTGTISITPTSSPGAPPSTLIIINIFIEVTAPTTMSISWAYIVVPYNESDLPSGVSESALRLFYWTGTEWKKCDNTGVDTTNNVVYANVTHFTIFAPMAEKTAKAGEEGGTIPWMTYTGVAVIAIVVLIAAGFMVKRKKGKAGMVPAKPSEMPPEQPPVPSVPSETQPPVPAMPLGPPKPSKPTTIRCPKCGTTFQVSGERPLDIVCPKCGTKGTLK